jgi:diacylglycerol kinase (ATP)|tara:strand:- start:12 stop:398 length:387 start_codon:yes stop_codon:yes gene_type:complete
MSSITPKKENLGWRRIGRAAGFSLAGLKRIWIDEEAFRFEVWIGVILLAPLMTIQFSVLERLALAGVWILVLIVEVLNSAVEAAVDQISAEWQDLSGKAKDLGSLAVTLILILAALVWGVILGSKFLS